MDISERVKRINQLSRKEKDVGLTDAEKTEQVKLRREYLNDFRKNFKKQLDNIEFTD